MASRDCMRKLSERERKSYLKRLWAKAHDVFDNRDLAQALVHSFALFEFGEESVSDLTIVEYEGLFSWLKWCQTRIDLLGEIEFACWSEEG
jgi:hypothetical protein